VEITGIGEEEIGNRKEESNRALGQIGQTGQTQFGDEKDCYGFIVWGEDIQQHQRR